MITLKRLSLLFIPAALFALFALPALSANVVVMVPGSLTNDEWEYAVEQFTNETGIDVEVVVAASWTEMMEKVPAMVAGGVGPDVIYHDNAVQSDLVSKGVMRPIEEFVTRDRLDVTIWPAPVVAALRYHPQYEGELYSLPTGVSHYATYYDPDKFYEAGLSDLTDDWSSTEFTFDDMEEMAKKLTIDRNGDGTPEQFGLQDFMSFGAQAIFLWDLRWINAEQTQFLGDSPQHVDALNRVRALYQEYGVIGGDFLRGTAAMAARQAFYLNNLRAAMDGGGTVAWKVAPNPLAECRCSFAGFHSWGMPQGAKNSDEGWAFIRYMTLHPEGAILFNRAENRVPVLAESVAEFESRWENTNPGMRPRVLIEGLNHARKSNWGGLPRNIFTTIRSATTRIVQGEVDTANALTELSAVIRGIMGDYK